METPCKWRFLILFSTVEDATMLVICSSEGSNISLHKQNSTSKMVNSVFSSTYLPVGCFFFPQDFHLFFHPISSAPLFPPTDGDVLKIWAKGRQRNRALRAQTTHEGRPGDSSSDIYEFLLQTDNILPKNKY